MNDSRCLGRVPCKSGYILDSANGSLCIDIDECAKNTHKCATDQICRNRPGSYACEPCPAGHKVGPKNQCVDIDECAIYVEKNKRSICGRNSHCRNTVGSYRCVCDPGFANFTIGHGPSNCEAVDICQKTPRLCQHDCINAQGSDICSCKSGFRLNSDNSPCQDINECEEFKIKPCIGICQNTPGSYACRCPAGYKLDVDRGICQGTNLKM